MRAVRTKRLIARRRVLELLQHLSRSRSLPPSRRLRRTPLTGRPI